MSDLRKPEIAPAGYARDLAAQQRLRIAVVQMGRDLAAGVIVMTPIELEALAQLCVDHFLPLEAARVRRWIPFVGIVGGQPVGG